MTTGLSEVEIENGKSFVGRSVELIGEDSGDKGLLNGGRIIECSGWGTNGEVKFVNKEVNIENESAVNHHVSMMKINDVSQESVNIHVDVSDDEIGQVSAKTIKECSLIPLKSPNGVSQGSVKFHVNVNVNDDEIGQVSANTINKEFDLIRLERSQVTDFDSDSSQPAENSKLLCVGIKTLEEMGLTHFLVKNKDIEAMVVDSLGESQESRMEEGEPLLSDIVGDDAKSEEQVKDNPEFIIQDNAFFKSDVKLQESNVKLQDQNKENVEFVYDNTEIILDDLKGNGSANKVVEDMDDMVPTSPVEVSCVFIDAQFEDTDTKIHEKENMIQHETYKTEIILDDLKGNESADKVVEDMDDVVPMSPVEVSSVFIDAEIEDTDTKIHEVEDMIQHETLCLEDENQFICESYRDKLVSNMGSLDEIQPSLNQKNEIEKRPKEPNSFEDNDSKTEPEVATLGIRKTYEEIENRKELQTPFQAADETKTISVVSTLEQGKKTDSSAEKDTDYQTMRKVAGKFNHIMKNKEPAKFLVRDSIFACLNEMSEYEEKEEIVLEFDKKSDKLRKEETECKLKEQIRIEKRNKANEKVREKRLRKKERKKTGGYDSNMNNGNLAKENEIVERNPKPHLSNRRKPIIILALALILTLIFVTNYLN